MFRTIVAIALGAIAGALSRYYVCLGVSQIFSSEMPLGTTIVNISGCLAMGFLTTLFLGKIISIDPDFRLLLLTGFLGSYTTFSTYELDSAKLLHQGSLEPELFYWMGSVVFGLLSLQLGIFVAKWLLNRWQGDRSI
ncbi:fluoride efflux transporter CrcB [[Phormidium ambiguum] IAM M-71]|nr:fluoride efflux transporter CrcB [Phormidium ambiguum]